MPELRLPHYCGISPEQPAWRFCPERQEDFLIRGVTWTVILPCCRQYDWLLAAGPVACMAEELSEAVGLELAWGPRAEIIAREVRPPHDRRPLWQVVEPAYRSVRTSYYVVADVVAAFAPWRCVQCGARINFGRMRGRGGREVFPIFQAGRGRYPYPSIPGWLPGDGPWYVCQAECFLHFCRTRKRKATCYRRELRRLANIRQQVKAMRQYLKTGDPGVLASLPRGYGIAPT